MLLRIDEFRELYDDGYSNADIEWSKAHVPRCVVDICNEIAKINLESAIDRNLPVPGRWIDKNHPPVWSILVEALAEYLSHQKRLQEWSSSKEPAAEACGDANPKVSKQVSASNRQPSELSGIKADYVNETATVKNSVTVTGPSTDNLPTDIGTIPYDTSSEGTI